MENKEIQELLDKYLAGECSEEESAYVETWYNRSDNDFHSEFNEEELYKDLKDLYNKLPKEQTKLKIPNWVRYAAIVFAVVSAGIIFNLTNLNYSKTKEVHIVEQLKTTDISPGGNKATLTLADGSQVFLDDASSGTIAHEAGNAIYKNNQGQIVYNNRSQEIASSDEPKFNTITIPKGGQYSVILPDGTKVWLNAASSLTYPTVFNNERVVELIGEAYFEVAKNPKKPFKVITNKQVVEVLGTHFNINSYEDEPITQTTLIEGAVKIVEKMNHQSVLLKPGEQASLGNHPHFNVSKVNSNDAIAWKNGLFRFQNANLGTIMRQFSRWYGVSIELEGKVPDFKLWGEVYRNVNASQALAILTYFNLKHRIEENNGLKKIIIY